MRAVVMREYGGPEVLRVEDVPRPAPPAGEVVIDVRSVSVNRTLDLVLRARGYGRGVRLPHVLGVDPAGVVAELGDGVDTVAVGDRVVLGTPLFGSGFEPRLIGVHRWGGYAEQVSLPAKGLNAIPDELSFAEATVVARHFPMAFRQLDELAQVRPGETVLVMGAAGAVGCCLVQVAKLLGATVIAAAGTDERVRFARAQGADFGVNYRTSVLDQHVRGLTNGRGAQVVCENIGDPDLWPQAFASLGYAGRMVTAGAHAGGTVTLDTTRLYRQRLRIIGENSYDGSVVERALEAAAKGEVRAVIDEVLPLEQAPRAHELVESGQAIGKVVLDPTLS